MTKVIVYPTPSELYAAAADFIITHARDAIEARGRFTLALSGGSTPERVHELLASPARQTQIDWSRTFVFVGDERFVPYDDSRSNYGMARRSLLSHVPIPAQNLHPIPTHLASPEAAAQAYSETLSQFFGALPQLDVNLLGLGDDGHTASLFPGKPTVHVTDRWVVSSPPGTLPPPVDRVTLTFPVLNNARAILMMATGENKAGAVHDVLEGSFTPDERPAVALKGALTWMLDAAAGSQLKHSS